VVSSTKKWLPPGKFDGPFDAWFHFLKNFWEPTLVGVKVVFLVEGNDLDKHPYSHIESRTLRIHTRMYIMVLRTHQQGDRLSYHQKFDKPFGVRFHF
jgi:hypothetical protein